MSDGTPIGRDRLAFYQALLEKTVDQFCSGVLLDLQTLRQFLDVSMTAAREPLDGEQRLMLVWSES